MAFRCCLALALALGPAAPVSSQTSEARFDFAIAGFRVGEVTLATAEDGDRYSSAGRVETVGIVGVFTSFFYDGVASGLVADDGTVLPDTFVANSRSPRANRRTEIDWDDNVPVRVSVVPPRADQPDPALQSGTIDPLSAAFVMLRDAPQEEICGKSVEVFDGSRRTRMALGAPSSQSGLILCAGTYSRLEGEAHSLSNQRAFDFTIAFRVNSEGIAELDRLETRTRFGRASLARRR